MNHKLSETSISEALDWARNQLQGGESPDIDSRVLLAEVLQKNQAYLRTWPERKLTDVQQKQFNDWIARRALGEPVAYIVGFQEFWTLRLNVNSSTLIPRPETELLVEIALSLALPTDAECLDLGTGTGAIALALASERPKWNVTGCDKVTAAVELAKSNQEELQLKNLKFLESHWFSNLPASRFDIIVTNPPYVEDQSPYLEQGDLRFEPRSALSSGEDGLEDIREIVATSKHYLAQNGYLLIEHGWEQGEDIRNLMNYHGFTSVQTKQDLNDLDRVTIGRL